MAVYDIEPELAFGVSSGLVKARLVPFFSHSHPDSGEGILLVTGQGTAAVRMLGRGVSRGHEPASVWEGGASIGGVSVRDLDAFARRLGFPKFPELCDWLRVNCGGLPFDGRILQWSLSEES